MSWSWFIYAPRPQAELLALADELNETLAFFLEANPDNDDDFGEIGAGGKVPTPADVRAKGRVVDKAIVDRLSTCKSSVVIDPVPDARLDSPLQVSALAWLLEKIGACVVDWGELDLALSETVLAELKKKPSRGNLDVPLEEDADEDDEDLDDEDEDFDDDDDDAPLDLASALRGRKSGPGAARAETLATKLRAAIEDVERSIDLRRALQRTSEMVRKYGAFLLEEGATDDEAAARALGVPVPEVDRAAKALAEILQSLEEE